MRSARPMVLAAEVSLAALTLSAVLGMSRLFDDGGWLGPLAVNAAVAHLVAAVLRRRGFPLPTAGLVMLVVAVVVTAWTLYWSTTAMGVPTGETWSTMQHDLGDAWRLYQDVRAPAPVIPGFLLASCVALWCVAYVADWAAFRLWVPFEATLPAGTLVLFTALLGTDRGRTWAMALFSAAVLTFVLLHRLARQETSSHWVADRRAAGEVSLLLAGAGLGIVAVVAGSIIGPTVPGADSPGMFDPTAQGRNEGRVTISPLVDIKSRLVDQAAVEVFTVRSTQRAYWRLTSLERFNGRIWSSSGSFREAGSTLPSSADAEVTVDPIEQTYTIEALAAIWLPSAFEPTALDADDIPVRYDQSSSTLIVDDELDDSDALVYSVVSASPRLATEDLSQVGDDVPEDIADAYLDLPEDFSPRVTSLAETVTADAEGPAAQARALQDHLRTFDYSLDAQAGHSGDALERFLFDTQVGYCEQFAGAFAAMARSIGLPARVAVGFTPGEEDEEVPGLYHVRGEYAHAWPEVYLAGAGWVAYEPTPGRGMPNAEPYTGVPEAQAAANDPGATVTLPTTPPEEIPSFDPADPGRDVTDPDQRVDAGDLGGDDDGATDSVVGVAADGIRRATPVVLGLGVAYLLLVPAALLWRRVRRRRHARTPLERVHVAWQETIDDARLLQFEEDRSDTLGERADHLTTLVPAVGPAVHRLAHALEVGLYAPGALTDDDAAVADDTAREARQELRAAAPRTARIRRWLDPRQVLTGWRRTREGSQRRITLTARADRA